MQKFILTNDLLFIRTVREIYSFDLYSIFILTFLFIDFRDREEGGGDREREIYLLFHLFIYSLVNSCLCADWGLNLQPWHIGTNTLTN